MLLAHLSDGVRPMKSTHFDWVITVPAIWNARAKRMMREAAYMVYSVFIFLLVLFHCFIYLQAGLTSDKPGIGGGTVDITVQDETADKVSVVLTPTGNAWGGIRVNKAFSELRKDIVGD